MIEFQSDKRVCQARRVFSPDDSSNRPSHYLLYFNQNNKYDIVSSNIISNIKGKTATLNVRGRKILATIVTYGTLADCEIEQKKLTSRSQDVSDDGQDGISDDDGYEDSDDASGDDSGDDDGNESIEMSSIFVEEDPKNTFASLSDRIAAHTTYNAQSPPGSTRIISNDDDYDGMNSHPGQFTRQAGISRSNKEKITTRKRKRNQTTSKKSKRQRTNTVNHHKNKIEQVNVHSDAILNNEAISKNVLNAIDTQMMIFQNLIIKYLHRIENKINSTLNLKFAQSSQSLSQYRSEKDENFPKEYIYNKIDLLTTPAKDIVDFARKTLRILFSHEELTTRLLPPQRDHLKRLALDTRRFNILLEAVRIKFCLDSGMIYQCYNDLLKTKLSNFLYEERRRETRKRLREEERLLKSIMQQNQYDHQQSFQEEGNQDDDEEE